jgi:hypothetical protein
MNSQSIMYSAFGSDSGSRHNATFVLSLLIAISLPLPSIILNSVLIILLGAVRLVDRHILLKFRNTLTNSLFLLFTVGRNLNRLSV